MTKIFEKKDAHYGFYVLKNDSVFQSFCTFPEQARVSILKRFQRNFTKCERRLFQGEQGVSIVQMTLSAELCGPGMSSASYC